MYRISGPSGIQFAVEVTALRIRSPVERRQESGDIMGLILLIILLLLVAGSVPAYPYSRDWGYAPSGGLGAVLIIVLILVLLGRI